MNRLALAAIAGLALLLSASNASADLYVSGGVGSDAQISGSLGSNFATQDNPHGRISFGSRTGLWAIEGSAAWVGLQAADVDHTLLVGSVDVKYFMPLGDRFEAFAKVGVNQGSLGSKSEAMREYEGFGYQVGGGLQLGFTTGSTPMTLWLDYNRATVDLNGEAAGARGGPDTLNGNAAMITVGLSISLR